MKEGEGRGNIDNMGNVGNPGNPGNIGNIGKPHPVLYSRPPYYPARLIIPSYPFKKKRDNRIIPRFLKIFGKGQYRQYTAIHGNTGNTRQCVGNTGNTR
jgi:hypothetical protein